MNSTESATPHLIHCPHCNAEYLAAEIFMPEDFAGKPVNIIKDPLGKFLYSEWLPDEGEEAEEEFQCEYCNKKFKILPVISYKVSKFDEALDFSTTTTSLI